MSKLLAIETSTEACSIAVSIDGEINHKTHLEARRHAELILPSVSELLSESGTPLGQLDAIAFGRGPGSFTSLRIGIGAVQGLAWGAELGVVPVSSLAALARGAALRHGLTPGMVVVAAIDARMNEVFHGCFEMDGEGIPQLVGAEAVSPPGSLRMPAGNMVIGAGNGFERYEELAEQRSSFEAVYDDQWPSAVDVIACAEKWLTGHEPLPAHKAQPLYIRDNVAEKPA